MVALLGAVILPAFLAPAAAGGGWGTEGLIETDNAGGAGGPQVAVDPSGNAVAVWRQSDGIRDNVWANRYVAGTGWGAAGLIETDNAGAVYGPQVGVDGSGNALAVWAQSDGTRENIWANRYVAGTGWGSARLIETDNTGLAIQPHVAVDGDGNAFAVWRQSDGTRFNTWSNRYVAGTGWSTAALIETDNVGGAFDPHVAVDGAGNAVAVWRQFDGTRDNVWSNRYVAGTGWGTAALIETDNAGYAYTPKVALDGSGNAIAVWYQSDGTRENIWANRYVAGTGWGTAGLIETDNAGYAASAQVAVDPSGNALAVWHQNDGTRNNIWANRYVAGTGWATAALIEANNAGSATAPKLAVDQGGNAVAVWYQFDGTRQNIWVNRYLAGTGWGTADLIETENAGSALDPQVAVDPSGNAVVVWRQSDGTRDNIEANRLVEDYPPALSLYFPANGLSTNMSTVWVVGVTEPGATAAVNGVPVWVAPDGSFGLQLTLAPSRNWIIVGAWDRAGNEAFASTNVTFNDPLPALEQELAAAQANLAAAEAELLDAEGRLAALEANATATQADREAAQANLTAAQTRVSALEAERGVTQAALAAMEARFAALDLALASAERNLTAAQAELASTRLALNETRRDAASATTSVASASGQTTLAMVLAGAGILAGVAGAVMGRRAAAKTGRAAPAAPEKPQ